MPREIQEPTLNERGEEEHPAFGRVVVNRVRSTPGAVLFDSDIRHEEFVRLTIHGARRKRELNQDWIYADEEIVEIQMTLSQWSSLVSSFGNGGGVSCTLANRREYDGPFRLPGLPFQSRMQTAMDETLSTSDRVYEDIVKAFEAYAADKKVGKLRDLELAIKAVRSNVKFAADQLTRYTEKTVQNARADVEAIVNAHARRYLGIDPVSVLAGLETVVQDQIEGDVEVFDESEQDDETWGAGPTPRVT